MEQGDVDSVRDERQGACEYTGILHGTGKREDSGVLRGFFCMGYGFEFSLSVSNHIGKFKPSYIP